VHRPRSKYSPRAAALEGANFGFDLDQAAMQIFETLITGRACAGQGAIEPHAAVELLERDTRAAV